VDISLDALIHHVQERNPDGDELARLSAAMDVSGRLTEDADALIGHFVDEARRAGASWTAIGERMGVTKQAAQKRFVAPAPAFKRFTERARRTLAAAEREARRLASTHVTPEHILIGLLTEPEGVAAKALAAQGVTLQAARETVEAARLATTAAAPARMPFAPQSKKVLELALREALGLDHNHIGTEHLLLAIISEPEGVTANVLHALGVDTQRLRRDLI
jgi:Clp amino terminal domain, pathogenicity island component